MPRTEQIQIKFSLEEKQQIQSRATEHGVYPSQLVRAVVLHASLTKDELGKLIEKDQLVRMEHAVGEAREEKPVKEFPVEAPEDEIRLPDINRANWIPKRTRELRGRMSSRNAEAQARMEWDDAHSRS
jgi:hypothetical protein